MKIAIFHNFMDNIGGAEIVDLILAKELKADIYTTNIDESKIKQMGFGIENIFSIGQVPINAPLKQELAYWRFRRLNLGKKYDFYIIAGDWAVAGARLNKPNLWYVYSPIREIWDLYEFTKKKIVPLALEPVFSGWVKYHRLFNKLDIKQVEKIIATSHNVQARLKKYLKVETPVIYPPVETNSYHYTANGNFWLSVNRLITHKRVDLQIRAFQKMPQEKLIIVGSYEQSRHFRAYAKYVNEIKPANVRIISWASQQELIDLYANCRGFITTAQDEDFGLTAVEAMAAGKPVIAPNEGGYRETVINGLTGKLIDDINVEKLIGAIGEIGLNPEKYREACQNQAKKFDINIFIEKIKQIIYGK